MKHIWLPAALALLSPLAFAQQDMGVKCDPGTLANCAQGKFQMTPMPYTAPTPAPTPASGTCQITTPLSAVGAGQQLDFAEENCGTAVAGWTAACTGTGCAAGTITSSGTFTGPVVTALQYDKGCQVGPNNSIWNQSILGMSASPYSPNWMGRVIDSAAGAPFHTNPMGGVVEADNLVEDSAPRQKNLFWEGGWAFNGMMFLNPTPPYVTMQAGWSMPVIIPGFGSFDNHLLMMDKQTCEHDQIYKPYPDFETWTSAPGGGVMTLSFTTYTIRTFPQHMILWLYGVSAPVTSVALDTGNCGSWTIGSGYHVGDVVNLEYSVWTPNSPVPATGGTATITAVNSSGGVTGVSLTHGGTGYQTSECASTSGGSGNAALQLDLTSNLYNTCNDIYDGDAGYYATITQQPNLNGGSGELTVPYDWPSSCTAANGVALIPTGLDSQDGSNPPYAGNGPWNVNAQSGGIYPLASNALLGGVNAAQSEIVPGRVQELMNNVANGNTCNNADGGLVLAWCHAFVTTTDNLMIAPTTISPAIGGDCNVNYEHPCYPLTAITNSAAPVFTTSENYNNNEAPCSGATMWSAAEQSCAAGMPFPVVISCGGMSCPSGNWGTLAGKHLVATANDSGGVTFTANGSQINTSTWGAFPGGLYFFHDWTPYGGTYRLKTLANGGINCEAICSSTSTTNPCIYAKAVCRSMQTFGFKVTDGTIGSDTWNSDIMSSPNTPDWIHDTFGAPNDTGTPLGFSCPLPPGHYGAANSFGNCLDVVDPSSLEVNGPADGTTNNQRVQICYGGTIGTACEDVVPQGTTIGLQVESITIPTIPGFTWQIPFWVNGNINPAVSFTMSPAAGNATVSSTGLITPPTGITSTLWTEIKVCSTAPGVSGACSLLQVFFAPVDSTLTTRLWLGSQDVNHSSCTTQLVNYTDHLTNIWYGYTDPPYQRTWQESYEQPGIDYAAQFGSWDSDCAGWGSPPSTDAELYGQGTQQVNDQQVSIAVPPTSSNTLVLKLEPGYDTTQTGENVFDVEAGGSNLVEAPIVASYQDAWTLAGCQTPNGNPCYKGITMPSSGAYQVTATDGMLHLAQRIRNYNNSQYEGISISGLSLTPGTLGPAIITTSLADGELTVAYDAALTAEYGTGPYTWSIIGTLPAGLTLQTGCVGLTCAIVGTPTAVGTTNFTVQIEDANNHTGTAALSIVVVALPVVTTTSLPNGTPLVSYLATLTETGGVPPFNWSFLSGSLPPGLMLGGFNGEIAGTPSASDSGVYSFEVQVKDANSKTGSANLSITIGAGPTQYQANESDVIARADSVAVVAAGGHVYPVALSSSLALADFLAAAKLGSPRLIVVH